MTTTTTPKPPTILVKEVSPTLPTQEQLKEQRSEFEALVGAVAPLADPPAMLHVFSPTQSQLMLGLDEAGDGLFSHPCNYIGIDLFQYLLPDIKWMYLTALAWQTDFASGERTETAMALFSDGSFQQAWSAEVERFASTAPRLGDWVKCNATACDGGMVVAMQAAMAESRKS